MPEPAVKISLAIIARDAGATLRKTIASARPYVDEVIIGLGGQSSDDTEAVARELADKVIEIDWRDDFSYARNLVWRELTGDWALWLDADDELVVKPGYDLQQIIREAALAQVNALFATYEYERDERGNLTCVLVRERLVAAPSLWSWTGRIHEILQLDEGEYFNPSFAEDRFKVVHQYERERDKGDRNLALLYQELAETEPEPAQRCLLYLFRENAGRGNWNEALRHGRRYMGRAKTGGVNDEAGQIAHQIAGAYRAIGDLDAAERADLLATRLAPTFPDGYFGLAENAYRRGDWAGVVRFTQAASAMPWPQTSLIVNELDYSHKPLWILGLAYAQMGDTEMALANLTKAAQISPDPELMTVLAALTREHDLQGVLAAYKTVAKHLMRWDEWLKVRDLLGVAPKLIEQHPDVRQMVERVVEQTAHVDDPQAMIDFYRTNPGWFPADIKGVMRPEWLKFPRMAFALKTLCEPPKYVLDMGSSDAFISLPLAKQGHHVTGYDLDPRCVDLANQRAKELGVPAQFRVGSVEDLQENETYDVALAFEIIEHLVDPSAFLDQLDQHATKVAITTPFLAWENGRLSDAQVEKLELKAHIRIFDLADVERLVAHRGRVLDLYREPWGDSAWIFTSYRPGERYTGNVTFLAPGTLEDWSPRTLREQGMGGSETALIRVTEELAAKHHVLPTVFGRINSPGYHSGVRYRTWDALIPEVRQDVYVAWRYPEAADLPIDGRMVLWVHDTDFGDRLTVPRAMRFDKIIVLSEWHRQFFLSKYPWLPSAKLVVIGNGVDPDRFLAKPAPKRDPHRVVYTSSADRGLDVILEHVWPKVVERVPDASLHVYYGWGNFKALETISGYKHLGVFRERVGQLMLDTINVVQHGRVTQEVLADELRQASVWLGPSHDFNETFCISAVEAQLAGCIPIHSGRAALAETVKSGLTIEGAIGRDKDVAEAWVEAIVDTLTADEKSLAAVRRKVIRDAAAQSWEQVADSWHDLLFSAEADA